MAAGVRVLRVDGAGQAVEESHQQAVQVVEEAKVLQINRAFVSERPNELGVRRIELSNLLVKSEQAPEQSIRAARSQSPAATERFPRATADPRLSRCRE